MTPSSSFINFCVTSNLLRRLQRDQDLLEWPKLVKLTYTHSLTELSPCISRLAECVSGSFTKYLNTFAFHPIEFVLNLKSTVLLNGGHGRNGIAKEHKRSERKVRMNDTAQVHIISDTMDGQT